LAIAGQGEVAVTGLPVVELVAPSAQPGQSVLHPFFPHPFNPATTTRYDLAHDSDVSVNVYNVSGQLVRTLVSGRQRAGSYSLQWDARDAALVPVAGGVYLCELRAGDYRSVQRAVLLR
jgi:hypothetical protein